MSARYYAATPHSCDVERLISAYNVIKTDRRASLSPDTLRKYLYIQTNMPVLSQFNFYLVLKSWLTEKDRNPSLSVPTSTAEYFNGVFFTASAVVENEADKE